MKTGLVAMQSNWCQVPYLLCVLFMDHLWDGEDGKGNAVCG